MKELTYEHIEESLLKTSGEIMDKVHIIEGEIF